MSTPTTETDRMIEELNAFTVPSSLMESFDAYREDAFKKAALGFRNETLGWLLDMLNRFRGQDRKGSLLDIFDPAMFTSGHPAWNAAPGTRIEMPALTSEVAKLADRDSEFAKAARAEIKEFRRNADTYADAEIVGLASLAAAALADQGRTFEGRENALRYLALNASAALEDLWACDDTLWKNAPQRTIEFDDMVAKRKTELLNERGSRFSFEEQDFRCCSEGEIRRFAFDMRELFLANRGKHLAICRRCRTQLESWTKLVAKFEQGMPAQSGRMDA